MEDNKFSLLDATALAELVRRGKVKPVELVDAAIERIERLNPRLNAVVTKAYEMSREAATGELPDGPFHGVPFLLKDLFADCAGVATTSGSEFLKDYVPDHDSELVSRYKRAGLLILGRTNTSEFAILPTTEPRLFGATLNPWDTTRSPGGSSGGSAVAVAAGMVPMAHAEDTGGSIRVPSSCCGVFGLKPTRARNPLGPDLGDVFGGFVVEHAITRSVRDSAALLDATSGPDVGDPYRAPPPERPFLEEVGTDPGKLRIAFSETSPTGVPVHEDCAKAVQNVARLCEELGHEVEEMNVEMEVEAVVQAFTNMFAAGNAWFMDTMAIRSGRTPTPELFEPLTWVLCEMGRGLSAPACMMAITTLQRASREIERMFFDYDAVLTPTMPEPPPPLGSFDSPPEMPLQGLLRAANMVPFTSIANFTGLPAMSVPLHWNDDGLPIGTQFIGRFGEEGLLFRLAAQLEEARPWADRRPPVSA